ncbi:iron-sulfur cluster carrier protein ApbC [Vibrio scophthalmi]|uniref:iron-sulfur cluster carrier protein ApbC n=1 Tax=Vibrio scophthalmi TaxID=45658 RepID=UPI002FF3E44A
MQQFTSKQALCDWLNQFQHPQLVADWASTPHLVHVAADQCQIRLPFSSRSLPSELNTWIEGQIERGQIQRFPYSIQIDVKPLSTHVSAEVKGVKNILAVTSAKGGVGKSTTSVNLALALAAAGANVGLLDADIYGPSVPMMIGQQDAKPQVRDNKWMQPIKAHGIVTQSIGYLVSKDEAAIWRGPMASKALAQLLNETEWPDLDYLVVDMPPGTGDIQLTLAQQIPVTSALIVTTPQDLALADARKGAAMFNKVEVPVVGLVENMSYHICSHCGEREHIFGAGGAEKMAQEYGLDLLAQVPLHIAMREDIDQGVPTVAARPDSEHSQIYLTLAEAITARMYWQGEERPAAIQFTMVE